MGAGLEQGSVFHLQGHLVDPDVLKAREDLLGTTSPSVLLYAGLDGWRRQMVEHGRELLGNALELAAQARSELAEMGFDVQGRDEFTGPGLARDLDPLPIVVDLAGLGTSGYRVADRLRDHHRINMHLADHRRISAQLTFADDKDTVGQLLAAFRDLRANVGSLTGAPEVKVPPPAELRLEQVVLPRDAFFGPAEQVPADRAAGRVSAEMITPYPPGIPAVLPGERITGPVIDYLRTGVDAGMVIPDTADPTVKSVRVFIER
jgi:arginine/lysine/ornithine decarboxylase